MGKLDFSHRSTKPDLTSNVAISCPDSIGPYKIESLFSKGGMSFLYLGIDPKNKTPLIIKVLSPRYVQNKEMVEHFLKEAKIISISNHPNIVKLYGQGKWDKGLYIAMEFIQGVSLRQFIQQKSLSKRRALEIILQVAYALCHLHTHGVIHRDLKPENILITESGDIKVIDFGIAQLQSEKEVSHKPRLIGTPAYMSPEQQKDPSYVSFASDIYSLGMIAYELLLGKLSKGVIQTSLLPKKLKQIIEKSLEVDPKKRYGDIVDFITEISHYLKMIEEEEKISDEDEIIDALFKESSALIPKATKWPNLEFGVASFEKVTFPSNYVDFIKLSETKSLIFLASCSSLKVSSIMHLNLLKGIFHATADMQKANPSTFDLIDWITKLNELIFQEQLDNTFSFSVIYLNTAIDQMICLTGGEASFYHIPTESEEIINIKTMNPPLGKDLHSSFDELTTKYNIHDRLILHTFFAKEKEASKILSQMIKETQLLPTQIQSSKILESMQPFSKKTFFSPIIISVNRRL